MRGKHRGNQTPYIDDRNAELLSAFRRAKQTLLQTKGVIVLNEALDIARCSPCSRYFVSEQRASTVIRKLLVLDDYLDSIRTPSSHAAVHGRSPSPPPDSRPDDPLASMIYMRRRMFCHLFARYKSLRAEHPDWHHEELVTVACASPASEFYLTIDSTREILSRLMRTRKS